MLTHAMIISETSADLHWSLDTVPKKGCHSNGERLYQCRTTRKFVTVTGSKIVE